MSRPIGRVHSDSERAYVAQTQVDELVRTAPSRFLGSLTVACIVAGTLYAGGFVPAAKPAAWVACLFAGILCQALYIAAIKRNRGRLSDRGWLVGFSGLLFLQAATWGWASFFLARGQPFEVWALPGISMLGLVASASATLGVFLPAFLAFSLGAMAPLLTADYLMHSPVGYAWFVLLSFFTLMVVYLGVDFNRGFVRRILADARLEEAAARQAQLRHLAEAAHAAKARQLFEISHDLRQPIHALGLLVRAMEEASVGTRTEPMVKSVAASAASLQTFAIGLLDYSNLESGKVRVSPSAFELSGLIARIFSDEAANAVRNHVSMDLRTNPATETLFVHCDAMLLERILRNLVSNAVKYTRGGKVRVRARPIGGARIQIDVVDNGVGIAPEHQSAIFADFHRIETDVSGVNGLGLGLAIVKRTADLIGAEITVRSRPGRGSRFRLVIPDAHANSTAPSQQRAASESSKQMSLLVADDSHDVLAALETVLAIDGHEIIAASNAEEALRKMEARAGRLDLAICDLRLGRGPDGVGLIDSLRERYGDALPAILVSGEDEAELARRAAAAGVRFLRKPFSVGRLREMIRQTAIADRDAG